MYKYHLCLRYLKTRYLAFICIVSILLGVATLIVVNSVMSGFSHKLKDRLLGTSADLTITTPFNGGFVEPPDYLIGRVMDSPMGASIEAAAPSVDMVGMLQFECNGQNIVKYVKAMGIDPAKQVKVGKFKEYLVNQKDAELPGFALSGEALAAWESRRPEEAEAFVGGPRRGDFLGLVPPPSSIDAPPVAIPQPVLPAVETPKPIGIIVGHALAHFQHKEPNGTIKETAALKIGDTVTLLGIAADDVRPVYCTYVVVDYFKSEMSEYDSQFVYMPLEEMQRLRHMGWRINNIQLKLKDGSNKDYSHVKPNIAVPLEKMLGAPQSGTKVITWEDTQGPLLAAIDIERGILNLLLFMIVGVAGFGILAIFTMIVSEKVRDIGILKSLGASNRGVMGIFVWYAFFLGIVGCSLGTLAGVAIVNNINEIEAWITKVTGHQTFDRSVYYFTEIPTKLDTLTIVLVNAGAMTVAVLASLVPAVRAARLRPIQALRFE